MRCAIALVLLAACGDTVELDLPADYPTWKHIRVEGEVPGHGDTFRVIYANDIAADPTWPLYGLDPGTGELTFGYRAGSLLVKEIYDHEGGTLKAIEAMRRDGSSTTALENEGDWLFATIGKDGGATHKDLCWNRCHVAAPFNGAWYDYRK